MRLRGKAYTHSSKDSHIFDLENGFSGKIGQPSTRLLLTFNVKKLALNVHQDQTLGLYIFGLMLLLGVFWYIRLYILLPMTMHEKVSSGRQSFASLEVKQLCIISFRNMNMKVLSNYH